MTGALLDSTGDFRDGEVLPFSKVDQFLHEFVYGKAEGEDIPNPIFIIGKLPPSTVEAVGKIIHGLSGASSTVQVSGRSLKHTDERRHDALKKIAAKLPKIIHAGGEVLVNPKRSNSAFLLYQPDPHSNYLLILELEKSGTVTSLVNLMTTTAASVRKHREKTSAWLAARYVSQHPNLPPEGAHAVSEFPDVQPSTDSILPQQDDISQIFEENTDGPFPWGDTSEPISIFDFTPVDLALDGAPPAAITEEPELALNRTIGDDTGPLFDTAGHDIFTFSEAVRDRNVGPSLN